jgi:uncharacterized protein YjiS (DUF1127 family)
MTSYSTTAAHRASFPRFMAASLASLRRRWARERTLAVLRDLDDRLLRDIGVSRGDLEAARNGRLPQSLRRFTTTNW